MVNEPNHTSEFSISYEGEALRQNTMDVRDLAPALLSLGQAFDRANSILNGDRASVNLNIRAIQPGSFEVSLILNQLFVGASNTLIPDWMTSALTLRDLLIGTPTGILGLILLIKHLQGKKSKQTEATDGIIFEADNIKLHVPSEVAKLYSDKPIRNQIEVVMRPLLKSGIDRVVFREKGKEFGSIQNTEAEYFAPTDDEGDNITEYVIPRQRLQIVSLVFNKEGKWRLNDGANIHWYSMDDKEFVAAIKSGKRFGGDDILVCEVLMTQQLNDTGKLQLDFSVKKVLSHITPEQQLSFPKKDG